MSSPKVAKWKKYYALRKNRITLFLLFFSLLSCSNPLDLDGRWIITKMTYNGEVVYPNTISNNIRFTITIEGYEGAEIIKFNTQDSTVIFPGFNSDEITYSFNIRNDSLKTIKSLNAEILDSTESIFDQDYKLIRLKNKYRLGLKSSKTEMIIIKESYLMEQRIKGFLH